MPCNLKEIHLLGDVAAITNHHHHGAVCCSNLWSVDAYHTKMAYPVYTLIGLHRSSGKSPADLGIELVRLRCPERSCEGASVPAPCRVCLAHGDWAVGA